jgi:hypothetical protein
MLKFHHITNSNIHAWTSYFKPREEIHLIIKLRQAVRSVTVKGVCILCKNHYIRMLVYKYVVMCVIYVLALGLCLCILVHKYVQILQD